MRQRLVLVPVTILSVLLAMTSAAADTPDEVLDRNDVFESSPSRSDGYLAYTEERSTGGRTFVKPDGEAAFRLNPPGTDSWSASLAGTTAAFDVYGDADSDIRALDVVTRDRVALPPRVNTRMREFDPALSLDRLLFARTNANRVAPRYAYIRLILIDLQTGERRILLDRRYQHLYVATGQVNGDWAAYETCRYADGVYSDCNVFRYNISTAQTLKVPNPDRQQYAAAVSEDGTMYFSRGSNTQRWRCGNAVTVVRYPVGGPAVEISSLLTLYDEDVLQSFAFDEADDSTTLYLGYVDCGFGFGSIQAIDHADEATD